MCDVADEIGLPAEENELSIASCTSLRRLALHCFTPTSRVTQSCLRDLASLQVEEFKFGMTLTAFGDDPDAIGDFVAPIVTTLLAAENARGHTAAFDTLRRVVCLYNGRRSVDVVLEKLKMCFSTTVAGRYPDMLQVVRVV